LLVGCAINEHRGHQIHCKTDGLGEVPRITRQTLNAVVQFMQHRPSDPEMHHVCFANQTTIATRAGLSSKTVETHLAMLEANRIIRRVRKHGGHGGRRGAQHRITLCGLCDQTEKTSVRFANSDTQNAPTKQKFSTDQTEILGGPNRSFRHAYREDLIKPKENQEKEIALTRSDDDKKPGRLPLDWRKADLEFLDLALPTMRLQDVVIWLQAAEIKIGVEALDAVLTRTRLAIERGDVRKVKRYVQSAIDKHGVAVAQAPRERQPLKPHST
jgi:hypothetical protein